MKYNRGAINTLFNSCLLHLHKRSYQLKVSIITIVIVFVFSNLIVAQPLAGTDELNRVLPQNSVVGNPVAGKKVAMFYFLWQGHPTSPLSNTYFDLTEIVAKHPGVLNNFSDQYWGSPTSAYYFWGQPIYNYYKGDDYWVHLKNIQLLTDAGVDILVLDATNALDYGPEANALMNAMDAVRAQGKIPPQLAFYTNSNSGATMQKIYNDFYKVGAPYRHSNCWFNLNNNPLIIGISSEAANTDYQSFFTFRESQWPNEAQKVNGWPWIEFVKPQRVFSNSSNQIEIVNVSVAQHPNPGQGMGGSAFYGYTGNWGRSYRNGGVGNPESETPNGYNFQEQWDFAITQNVPFIFVTGWNEWIAGRWASQDGNAQHSLFVDAASPEYSRDIEPSLTGNLKDNYYMQLVSNIRKYKGIEASSTLSASFTITGISDWTKITPEFSDYTGDVLARNNAGAQPGTLTNNVAINNYGFETPVIGSSPGFVQAPAGGSWIFTGTCGIVTNGGAYGNPTSIEGSQASYLQQTGSFEQSVSFNASGNFQLSFNAAQRTGNTQIFSVFYDATLIGSFTPSSSSFTAYTGSFAATSGTHIIKFTGNSTGDNTAFIDNINIGVVTGGYLNTTGRNDFSKLKVARNASNLYFYAKTVNNITPASGSNWMCLYLDLDRNMSTGWKGYDYKVTGGTTLQKWTNGAWVNVNTVINTVTGSEMYITIPKSYLGGMGDYLNAEFKWSDNMQNTSDPLDWYVNGDAAPGGRFNFIAYTTEVAPRCGIINKGFEVPALANGTFQYMIPTNDWNFTTLSGIASNGSALGNPNAPEGVQCSFLQRNGTIYQDINFISGTYNLSFWGAQRPTNAQSVNVFIDNVLISTITPASSSNFIYYSTSNFTVTAGNHRIQLTGASVADQTAFIDKIEIAVQTSMANMGFETPVTTDFQYNPTPDGWTFSPLSGVAKNGSALSHPTVPEGVQCGFIQRNYSIFQDINFSAGSYKLNLSAALRPLNVQSINIFIDNAIIGTISPSSSTAFNYYSTNNFSVTAGMHRLQFTGTRTDDQTAFIDDIKFMPGDCNQSFRVLPIEFLNAKAIQKGSGVDITWSTSQEINSKLFRVEKSSANDNNWSVVATINAVGNSSVLQNYNTYDPAPVDGVNFYRIKEFDKDGKYKTSNTLFIKLNNSKSAISLSGNPFHKSFYINFLNFTNQNVSAKISDISGKQVATEKWSVTAGTSLKEFNGTSNFQSGVYILSLINDNGEIIYKNKVIKL